MIILSCSGINLSFGTKLILDNITFNIQESDRVGIVGVNGAGKTTLFKVISGALQSDGGEVFISRHHKMGYLEQNSGLDSSNTIWDELMSAFSGLIEMENRIKFLEGRISTEKDETILSSLMKEYSSLTEKFSRSGGFEYNSRVKGVLRGLGFNDDQFKLKISNLSGGQKTRLALAKLLLDEPDILLLDEPTNHLDISAIEWLEDYLKGYRKCVLLISHDRYFLDVVTSKTLELENCGCKLYNGNYTEFTRQKALDRDIQQKHYDLQQKEISRMEDFIEQQKRWNREKNIIAAESRQKAIDRIEKLVKPKDLPDKIKISFQSGISSGNDVLFVEGLSKAYPGKPLFNGISFNLKKSEKVFLLGPNGCGKSTLLKILTGRLEKSSGSLQYGHKVAVGYYDQELSDLDESNTVIDEVWNFNEIFPQTRVRNVLASFLFKGEDVFKPVSILSGGEKSRVALIKLMLSGSNFLILDEPTNHLDINSREILEESLRDFDGTILAVSHDRYFINKLASRILEMDNYPNSSLTDCNGNYSYYLERRSMLRKNASNDSTQINASASKLERIAVKGEKAKQRKLEKQLTETECEINEIEARLGEIERDMLIEEVFTDHVRLIALHAEQERLQTRLGELYELWEVFAAQKEEMDNITTEG